MKISIGYLLGYIAFLSCAELDRPFRHIKIRIYIEYYLESDAKVKARACFLTFNYFYNYEYQNYFQVVVLVNA